ncbi:hypothetical protein NQ317_018663 [Molorchus minor]|uniref:Uncharacterized protein n=1 Tax=Molorchus minor TaxID=1323400 RepID=A0ABQ9JHM7_9CUCU|nr:hypothetical protein NQ317_018663 [Molorchus minor]
MERSNLTPYIFSGKFHCKCTKNYQNDREEVIVNIYQTVSQKKLALLFFQPSYVPHDHTQSLLEDLSSGVCKNKQCEEEEIYDDIYYEKARQLLFYENAPVYMKHNSFILSGYRSILNNHLCLESIFWWTNETVNIWSHIFGLVLFIALTIYDLILVKVQASIGDKIVVGSVLVCFQMAPKKIWGKFEWFQIQNGSIDFNELNGVWKPDSSVCCCLLCTTFSPVGQKKDCHLFLSYDLFGIALSLLAIYTSGVYYAFWCEEGLQNFYLSTVTLIFVIAMMLQIPKFKINDNVKMLVFVAWAAYGVIPTLHWTIHMGGFENPVVAPEAETCVSKGDGDLQFIVESERLIRDNF